MKNAQEQKLLKDFGKSLAQVRKDAGMTQRQLADTVDMSTVAIGYIETGKRWVRPLTLHKIAKALKVDIHTLFRNM